MGWKYNCECHLVTLILVLVVLTLSFFLQTIIHFNVSFSSYFIWSGAQKLSLHMLLVSFHRREGQCICSFSEENITLNARDLNSLLSRIILKIYYDKCSWRDNPGCCLSEIRMRKQVLKKKFSPCLSFDEKMGRNIWSWVWIQRYNLKIPLLAHYTHYLSSFAALSQLHHPLFPSGLLLFSASLAANELRYRTACLLSLFFPNIHWGAGGLIHSFLYLFFLHLLRERTGDWKMDGIHCACSRSFGGNENYLDYFKS